MPLWRGAQPNVPLAHWGRGRRRRGLHHVKPAGGSTPRHSEHIGGRTTAWMQEVEQRMEQLPSRMVVRNAG